MTTRDTPEAICDCGCGKSDPFYEELKLHGKRPKRMWDSNLRDRVRENVDDCERCQALIERFDAALMGAFLDGTGPFA